tara:strand:+ start:1462 stop:1734 length:273 start_codon:yes stop_codon:yes gene_type:complete
MFECKECQKVYEKSEDKNDPDLCRCIKCTDEYEEGKGIILGYGYRHSFNLITEITFDELTTENQIKIINLITKEIDKLAAKHYEKRRGEN